MQTQYDRIGRLPDVKALTGLGRSTLYARIAGKSDKEIQALVAKLEAERKAGAE